MLSVKQKRRNGKPVRDHILHAAIEVPGFAQTKLRGKSEKKNSRVMNKKNVGVLKR